MRTSTIGFLCMLLVIAQLAACGSMQAPQTSVTRQPEPPRTGNWSLEYTGECAGREAETLLITTLDESGIVFDEFELLRNEAGEYVGSAIFIAPMPVDGREIPYEVTYRLIATDDGGFSGTETIVEGGGHGLDCPIALVYLGAQ